jgi:hypothetical protein
VDICDHRFRTGHDAKLCPRRSAHVRWEGETLHVFRVIPAPVSRRGLPGPLLQDVGVSLEGRASREQGESGRCRGHRLVAMEAQIENLWSPTPSSPASGRRGVEGDSRGESSIRLHEVEHSSAAIRRNVDRSKSTIQSSDSGKLRIIWEASTTEHPCPSSPRWDTPHHERCIPAVGSRKPHRLMLALRRAIRIAKGVVASYGLAHASRCYRWTTCTAENSEVLPPGSVAVILCCSGISTAWTRVKEMLPSVVTLFSQGTSLAFW